MRIGFDVSQTAEDKAGCGFFADQLIRNLIRIDKKNDYLLYPTFYSYRIPSFYKATQPDSANCRFHFRGLSFEEMSEGWNKATNDRTDWLGSPDIIHCNNFSCANDHKAKIIYTIYDVSFLFYPEVTTEENRLICFDGLFRASLYANHCVAISNHTKNAFLSYFPHYPEKKVTVIPLGTRPTIRPIKDPLMCQKILKKFQITDQFWLGVGTIEPRKNYQLLIEAYSELNDHRPLVIAGGKGWLESDLGKKVGKSGLKDRIKFIGYVSDEELSALYSSCFAFVYPSLYEGFGLPVLEAMSCGASVITSDSSSLPEVGGEAVLYIDPKSKRTLIDKMKLLIQSESLRRELGRKSTERAKIFLWDESAKIVLDVYEKTVNI